MATFSNSGEDVIKRVIEAVPVSAKTEEEIREYYELDRCLEFIRKHNKVALQFPDHLLQDAATVAAILQKESNNDVYILGDTSYGSCCVDEVAAEHIHSEAVIHFGPACLTETQRLPVLYVFGYERIDIIDCADKFKEMFTNISEPIIVLFDVIYNHMIDSFKKEVSSIYTNLIISQLVIPSSHTEGPSSVGVVSKGVVSDEKTQYGGCGFCEHEKSESDIVREKEEDNITEHQTCSQSSVDDTECSLNIHRIFGRIFHITRSLEEYKIFYIGTEGTTLTNFMLTYHNNQFYSYNPVEKTCRRETTNVNKMLGRRYYLIQRAKEASTIGILVGTLGAINYLSMIKRMKSLLKKADKKYYTVAVGKLNPAKLANFMEIDIYVLVACPHCSLLDTQEFYRPIVTPYEMEVACLSSREWSGDVIMDYQQLLPGGQHYVPVEQEENTQPEYSFLTGQLLPLATNKEIDNNVNGEQSLVSKGTTVISLPYSGDSYLQSRSWQGLERRLGETEVKGAVEGRQGLPTSYTHETQQ